MCRCYLIYLVFFFLGLNAAVSPIRAQRLPKEDIVEVPALGDGLCLSNVFQSNMVLQRDKPINVWGWAAPGDTIEVKFGEHSSRVDVGYDRSWRVTLPAMPAEREPQVMTVRGKVDLVELENILVGDLWVLGGQSNMEFELAKVENGQLEIVSANFPQIRILTVPYGIGPDRKDAFARLEEWSSWFGRHFRKGDWDVCTPEVAKELSAIGYVFARRIHQASQIPIGVIDASRGGTTVETWTPFEVLKEMDSPATQAKLASFQKSAAEWDAEADLAKRKQQHEQWIATQQSQGKSIPADRRAPPSDLRPGPLGDHNYPGHCYAGMIAPLEGLSIKGVIFHQGYNNAFDGSQGVDLYQDVFPEMIQAWRTAFNDPELPFGILSLCTDGYPQTLENYCEKMLNAGIEIRAAQYATFLKLFESGDQNVGFVSTYDLRRRWYHPQLKLPAGERVARWALATEYGFEGRILWKPPMLKEMKVEEHSLRLAFDQDVGDPEDGAILGFAIAGDDRRFHPATAAYVDAGQDNRGRPKVDRKQLRLSSIMVEQPVHFRYAWGRNPLANLQATGNKDLPFATQRSDSWRIEQVPKGILAESPELPIARSDRNKLLQALKQQDQMRVLEQARKTVDASSE